MLEWMVQQALELEMGEHLGADHYERSEERLGYRNGHTLCANMSETPTPQ